MNLSCFPQRTPSFLSNLGNTKNAYYSLMWSRKTKHVSKVGKVDPGDRVTQAVEILLVNPGYL